MERVELDSVDNWMGPASIKRPLGQALGAEHVAVNYYELEPGESFAFGYHAHDDQEEVFFIIKGTVTFETEDGELTVGANESVFVPPGEFQRGVNTSDSPVRALAIGAPADMGETTILRACSGCGERTEQTIEPTDSRDALVTLCIECDSETGRFD